MHITNPDAVAIRNARLIDDTALSYSKLNFKIKIK